MPQGIVPELIVGLLLVAIIVGVVVATRRPREQPPAAPEVETPPEALQEPAGDAAVVVEERPEAKERAEVVERPSLKQRLAKSRRFLTTRLSEAFGGGIDDETWEDVEAVLIQADVGMETATAMVDDVRSKARERGITDGDEVMGLLMDDLAASFEERDRALAFAPDGLSVWLVMGVNGTGKTTTIGKLAGDLAGRGRTVALAAADTFRAAADEQLEVWAQRANAQLVKHQQGADPGAVAFDAMKFAAARDLDVLLIDTAGRLHTKRPLMDELAKIRRVVEKERQIQEGLLVIDATAGQNGLAQAREFAEAGGVTGIVLTKLDGTAKGGIALTIERSLGIPIKLIGVGEGIEDLEPFDPKAYAQALLA